MYSSQETFPWILEQETVFIKVSRNDLAGVGRARVCKTCFENQHENGGVAIAKPCACSIKRWHDFCRAFHWKRKALLAGCSSSCHFIANNFPVNVFESRRAYSSRNFPGYLKWREIFGCFEKYKNSFRELFGFVLGSKESSGLLTNGRQLLLGDWCISKKTVVVWFRHSENHIFRHFNVCHDYFWDTLFGKIPLLVAVRSSV